MASIMEFVSHVAAKLRPKSPTEYQAQLFTTTDLPRFDLYREALARWTHLRAQGDKFERVIIGSTNAAQAAAARFRQTLTDEDFAAAVEARATAAKMELFRHNTGLFQSNYTLKIQAAGDILEREFPGLAGKLAGVLEWMAERAEPDIERVRAQETARLAAWQETDADSLSGYGIQSEETAPIEERSKVLKTMLRLQRELRASIESLRPKSGLHVTAASALAAAGQHIEPVLTNIRILEAQISPGHAGA